MDAGFAIVPDVFAAEEMAGIAAHLSNSRVARTRAGARHLLGDVVVASLARDERMTEIAAGLLGAVAIPYRATLFDKSPDSNWLVAWHQDTALPLEGYADVPGWGSWSEKHGVLYAHAPSDALARVIALRVHLDDSTSENGPLRVIAGSHREGVLTDEQVLDRARGSLAETCVARRGGIVAMRPLVIHASSKAREDAPRRVLHIEYAASLDIAPGLRLRVV